MGYALILNVNRRGHKDYHRIGALGIHIWHAARPIILYAWNYRVFVGKTQKKEKKLIIGIYIQTVINAVNSNNILLDKNVPAARNNKTKNIRASIICVSYFKTKRS